MRGVARGGGSGQRPRCEWPRNVEDDRDAAASRRPGRDDRSLGVHTERAGQLAVSGAQESEHEEGRHADELGLDQGDREESGHLLGEAGRDDDEEHAPWNEEGNASTERTHDGEGSTSVRSSGTTLASTPMLVALRSVRGPDLRLAQGFVVDSAEVARILASSPVSATFVNGSPSRGVDAPSAPRGSERERRDLFERCVRALTRRRRSARASCRDFGIGSGAAALAGLAMVGHGVPVPSASRAAGLRPAALRRARAAHAARGAANARRDAGRRVGRSLSGRVTTPPSSRLSPSASGAWSRTCSTSRASSAADCASRPSSGTSAPSCATPSERQRLALEASGAPVELTVADVLPSACFDADALRQILLNLLDNAERYARESRDRTISVSVSPQGAHVAVTVADRGPGMPRRRGPFAWLGAMPHPASGLGIGLHLVRALTGAMGGSVSMRDDRGWRHRRNRADSGRAVAVFSTCLLPATDDHAHRLEGRDLQRKEHGHGIEDSLPLTRPRHSHRALHRRCAVRDVQDAGDVTNARRERTRHRRRTDRGRGGRNAAARRPRGPRRRCSSPPSPCSIADRPIRVGKDVTAAIDAVAGQRDAWVSRLYWYTDWDAAVASARAQGKPILSLRLLGRLDQDLELREQPLLPHCALCEHRSVSRSA